MGLLNGVGIIIGVGLYGFGLGPCVGSGISNLQGLPFTHLFSLYLHWI